MRRIFTFLLAMASFTSLLADDIQFTNLPYTHYGDSVRVSANTSLSDLPMPTNYEYGFEYEYKSTDGESGGGGVEPCAITNGHMEVTLKKKWNETYQCYRYRPYYVLDSWTGERASGEWVLISEWSQTTWPEDPINPMDGVNTDSLIAAIDLHTLSPVVITDDYVVVAATSNMPSLADGISVRCGFEIETGTGQTHINGWRTFENGRMQDTLRYNGPYNTFSYRAFIDIDYVPRIEGEWIEIPEWENIMQGTCGENVNWRFSPTDSVLTISGTGEMTNYKSNTTPWYNVFRQGIKTVVVLEGVTSIGNHAFNACNNLKSVVLPSTILSIGTSAFSGCSSLHGISIPNSVTRIQGGTFNGCKSLRAIHIPDVIISIGESAFANCSSLQSIIIPNNVDSIGNFAFNYCSSLRSVTFPESLSYVGKWLMQMCTSLSEVTLPQNIETIESDFFNGCSSLRRVSIPSSVQKICSGAFRNCTALDSLVLPQNVVHVGASAYVGCTGLMYIFIPQYLTQIETGAFSGCTGLMSIEVSAQNTTYDSRENCHALIETESDKMILCGKNSTIPSSVRELGNELFRGRTDLVNFTIPDGITTIGNSVFNSCTNLQTISIPQSVTQIGIAAFGSCSALTDIQLPSDITRIEDNTFGGCSSLTSIVIPDNVKSLGDEAFKGCYALLSVTLPNGLQSIGKGVFRSLGKFTTISIPESVNYIGATAFHDCGIWRNEDNWDGDLLYIDNCLVSAQHGQQPITGDVIIKEGTRVIGSQMFRTYKITSIILPKTVTHINGGAFAWCDWLQSITCEATTPPIIEHTAYDNQYGTVFYGVDKSIPVYVPAGAEELYRTAEYWSEFTNIRAIGQAQTADVEDIQAEPTSNSVVLEWPVVINAVVYTIEIRKNGELICTLSFNSNGQLMNVQFAMPARNRANAPKIATETVNGWSYTIAGLEPNTAYSYTVIAQNSESETIYNNSITFTTQQDTPTGIEETNAMLDTPQKIMIDGQILILRGDKTYTLQGQEVK